MLMLLPLFLSCTKYVEPPSKLLLTTILDFNYWVCFLRKKCRGELGGVCVYQDHLCTGKHACVYVSKCMLENNLMCFASSIIHPFWRQGPSLAWNLTRRLGWVITVPQGPSVTVFAAFGITIMCHFCPHFSPWIWGLSSGPHTYKAGTLRTELAPQPQGMSH